MDQPPAYLARAIGLRIAYRHTQGTAPTVVFLPGYMSDMRGSKAEALDEWARTKGRAFLRLDYAGCGESDGQFTHGTLASWTDDALDVITAATQGPLVLIGSSMGGWLMLHLALALRDRVVGLIGIAAAPDFTQWGFSDAEKAMLASGSDITQPSEYGPDPVPTTAAFWHSGQAMQLLGGPIEITCPVRLLQGQCDPEVPWELTTRLSAQLRSSDVQTVLIKDGDHRLSRPQDLALLTASLEQLLDQI